jgi:hypothetical protein
MNLFSALRESIQRVFGSKHEPTHVSTQPSEPIPPIIIAPTNSSVTTSDPKLVIEKGGYRPTVSGPETPTPLASPSPDQVTQDTTVEAKSAKPVKTPRASQKPKVAKAVQTSSPKASKRVKKTS